MDGAIIVDKPEGWTSHDVVGKMRRIAGTRRIGHLGTLDPLATGVLPLVIEKATRLAQFYLGARKRYEALIRFGYSTDSYDRDGEPASAPVTVSLVQSEVERALDAFRGTILQTPPAVSAKKIGGVPAYKLARKKEPVELKPVEVTIHSLDLLECLESAIRVDVQCSAGTYLRSLAHDLGQKLGCGAFVERLRRTQSSEFTLDQARTLEQLEELSRAGRLEEALIPAARLVPAFPGEVVDAVTVNQIRQGRDFRVSPFRVQRGAPHVKAIGPDGSLVAIGEIKMPNLYHPVIVL